MSSSPAATSAASRVRSAAVLCVCAQLVEDEQAAHDRARRAAEQRPRRERRLGLGRGERHDRAARRDELDRAAEGRAADALDDRVVALVVVVEVEDDALGPELAQAASALLVARDAGHVRTRARRELHGEAPDAAAGAGDEHALAEHEAADLQRPQRRDAGDGQRRRLREAHAVGQLGERPRRDGDALRPRATQDEPDDARARRAARCRRRPPARRRPRSPSPSRSRRAGSAGAGPRRGSARSRAPRRAPRTAAARDREPPSARRVAVRRSCPKRARAQRTPRLRESDDGRDHRRRHGRRTFRGPTARRGRTRACRRSRRARTRRGARGRRTTAGCARRCSATATGSCTARPSGA